MVVLKPIAAIVVAEFLSVLLSTSLVIIIIIIYLLFNNLFTLDLP